MNAPLEISWSPSESIRTISCDAGVDAKSWKDLIVLNPFGGILSPASTRPPNPCGISERSFPARVRTVSPVHPSGIPGYTSSLISFISAPLRSGTGSW